MAFEHSCTDLHRHIRPAHGEVLRLIEFFLVGILKTLSEMLSKPTETLNIKVV